MSSRILAVDNNQNITQLIKNILRDAEMLANKPKPNVQIYKDDHGWYRKFEKTNKRKNFTKI